MTQAAAPFAAALHPRAVDGRFTFRPVPSRDPATTGSLRSAARPLRPPAPPSPHVVEATADEILGGENAAVSGHSVAVKFYDAAGTSIVGTGELRVLSAHRDGDRLLAGFAVDPVTGVLFAFRQSADAAGRRIRVRVAPASPGGEGGRLRFDFADSEIGYVESSLAGTAGR